MHRTCFGCRRGKGIHLQLYWMNIKQHVYSNSQYWLITFVIMPIWIFNEINISVTAYFISLILQKRKHTDCCVCVCVWYTHPSHRTLISRLVITEFIFLIMWQVSSKDRRDVCVCVCAIVHVSVLSSSVPVASHSTSKSAYAPLHLSIRTSASGDSRVPVRSALRDRKEDKIPLFFLRQAGFT